MRVALVALVGSLVGLVIGLAMAFAPLFPSQASAEADDIDFLWSYMAIIAGILFGLVTAVLLVAIVRFRGRRGDDRDGPPIHGITWLEIAWTLVPTLIVASIVFFSWQVLNESNPSEDIAGTDERGFADQEGTLEVGVIGFRYGWDYDMPALELAGLKELVLPVGQPVKLNLVGKLPEKPGDARDVIHNFWVPDWRVQMAANPGKEVSIGVRPTREGSYPVVCAFICGPGHAQMNSEVSPTVPPIRVVPRAEFERWVGEQRQAREQAAQEGEGEGDGGTTTTGASDSDA